MTRFVRAAKAVSVAAVLMLAPAALAGPEHGSSVPFRRHHHWASTPEFDPAAGGALVALLAGGALFVASRRKSR